MIVSACFKLYMPFYLNVFAHESEPDPQVLSSVSDPEPDSIRSLDPDSESGSRSRRAKMTQKIDVLYGGVGIQ
jgi:hypothetical protein